MVRIRQGACPQFAACCNSSWPTLASALTIAAGNYARINYYAHTPNPSVPGGKRVYNGFVMLTINSNGQVNEAFYEQNNPNSVWSGTYSWGG